jgi:adenine nucleotide transporter 17
MSDSFIHATSGAAGGIVAMSLTYPLIFLSTRASVDSSKHQKSTYQAIIDVLKSEGLLGLYSGLSSSLLGIAVTNGVYYGFYEKTKAVILKERAAKGLSTFESMLAGFIAGSATTIISNPIWVIQTNQAVRTMSSSSASSSTSTSTSSTASSSTDNLKPIKKLGFIETIYSLLEKEGPAAFWRGIGPALVLVINPILQYTVFEQLKNKLMAGRTRKLRAIGSTSAAQLTDMDFFFLGALSKLVATSLTYPYIVVKSRFQAGHISSNSGQYKSSFHALLTILHKEGLAGLYKGIGSKLVQSVLTAAILFAGQKRFYEITKKTLTAAAVVKA